MNWIIDNWSLILLFIVVIAFLVSTMKLFIDKPNDEQIDNVKEWLKYAVSLAEKDLGNGTGQLKLRQVYDAFVTKFPRIAMLVSFNTFSLWVDEALAWMKLQLEKNKNIKDLVEGDNNG